MPKVIRERKRNSFDGVKVFWLGSWLVEPSSWTLRRNDEIVHLTPKVMELLLMLVSHQGEVIFNAFPGLKSAYSEAGEKYGLTLMKLPQELLSAICGSAQPGSVPVFIKLTAWTWPAIIRNSKHSVRRQLSIVNYLR